MLLLSRAEGWFSVSGGIAVSPEGCRLVCMCKPLVQTQLQGRTRSPKASVASRNSKSKVQSWPGRKKHIKCYLKIALGTECPSCLASSLKFLFWFWRVLWSFCLYFFPLHLPFSLPSFFTFFLFFCTVWHYVYHSWVSPSPQILLFSPPNPQRI